MNGVSVLLAKYVRDLLGVTEGSVVFLGRVNVPRDDTAELQIAVDQLAPSNPLTDASKYNGQSEVMSMCQMWRAPMTIDFMGPQGYNEAIRFMALSRHQKGYEVKQALGIDVHLASGLQDIKILQGEQYSERFQLEVNMIFNIVVDVETLRIDEAQFNEFLVN